MSSLSTTRVNEILGGLHDFQRRTVEYVYRRMYEDQNPAHRFLVADEVGLGKTMVAKGLIARAIHRLQDQVGRVDVIYICSNAQIAHQNLARLNIFEQKNLALATRLTMLPQVIKEQRINENDVNFISFTPGTALEHGLRMGRWEERRIIYLLLCNRGLAISEKGLENVLRGAVGVKRWKRRLFEREVQLDESLGDEFARALKEEGKLLKELRALCDAVELRRTVFPKEHDRTRLEVIGSLRALLAKVCIKALEPDLIILDEFQRFRHLLTGDDDASLLARELMDYRDKDTGERARTVLLSATPYKMLTLNDEEENHYEDFLKTLSFLLEDEQEVRAVQEDFKSFRRFLIGLRGDELHEAQKVRDSLQNRLLRVMVRTERLSAGVDREAMLRQPNHNCGLEPSDLHQARGFDGVAQAIKTGDVIEYWKSCSYPLNFMSRERYGLKRKLRDLADKPPTEMSHAFESASAHLLSKSDFAEFRQIDPANPRLRRLIQDMLDNGLWQLLWLPPSMPYYELAEPWASQSEATKALIFSHWNVVPDAIASLCSYEAERRMTEGSLDRYEYFDIRSRKPLLRYNISSGRLGGFGTMLLMYPSPTLACLGDPLQELSKNRGVPLGPDELRKRVRTRLEERLQSSSILQEGSSTSTGEQTLWYAIAILELDKSLAPEIGNWILSEGDHRWITTQDTDEDGDDHRGSNAERKHREEFASLLEGNRPAGSPPDDLLDVLTELAIGGPAVCCLRALNRSLSAPLQDHCLLSAATRAANGLRSLFNQPETILLLRENKDMEEAYWRRVLGYCLNGNLQAVLDEYAHVVWDQDSFSHNDVQSATGASERMDEALSLRSSPISLDVFSIENRGRIKIDQVRIRCRFAQRLGGDKKSEDGETANRPDLLRRAFNSPFRPFILATTSIGQEGLDFHPYCHAIYHWNLPSNPVDLEQREGRIHRYKGHAVRKNIAKACGESALSQTSGAENIDPWRTLFEEAIRYSANRSSDLIPYWLFPLKDGANIERRILLHPLSRDAARLKQLIKSLAVYRLAFGQPRQEDLLAYLEQDGDTGLNAEDYESLKICLQPVNEGASRK